MKHFGRFALLITLFGSPLEQAVGAQGTRSFEAYGLLGLNRDYSAFSLNSATSRFEGWGWSAEAGLDVPVAGGGALGFTISGVVGQTDLTNTMKSPTFSERGELLTSSGRFGLFYRNLGLGAGMKNYNFTVTTVNGSPAGSTVKSTGKGWEGYVNGAFDYGARFRSVVEIAYSHGAFGDLVLTEMCVGLKFGVLLDF